MAYGFLRLWYLSSLLFRVIKVAVQESDRNVFITRKVNMILREYSLSSYL